MGEEADLDDVWVLCRDVLEKGASLCLTDELRALLSRTARQVAIRAQDADDALRAPTTATTLLKELHQRIGEGSRRLDRARNRVEELQEEGNLDGAQHVIRDLLAVEVVPFYREQARLLLGELVGLADVLSTGRIHPDLNDRQQLTVLSLRIQQGHALESTDELCALLRRSAPTAGISAAETEENLKRAEGAEALIEMILSRFRESERRFLDSMYRMTSLRDAGHLEDARQQLRDLLAVEMVPQYRRMAEEQLHGLNSPRPQP